MAGGRSVSERRGVGVAVVVVMVAAEGERTRMYMHGQVTTSRVTIDASQLGVLFSTHLSGVRTRRRRDSS